MKAPDDPLARPLTPDRVYYATGTMLGAEDFTAEQVYHRFQLARALAYLHGRGTVAGLRVVYEPETGTRPERLVVQPGLAIDRLGRLIEVPRHWCIRLDPWFVAQTADALEAARKEDVEVPVSDDAADPPAATPVTVDGVVADLFLRFAPCSRGLTPAFQSGPFEALDAVAPSRVRDGFALDLVLRDDPNPQVPEPPPTDLAELDDEDTRARAGRKAVLNGWRETAERRVAGSLEPTREHKLGQDPTSLFLARVIIPADEGPPITRLAEPVVVDNYSRLFVWGAPALARVLGL